MKKRLVTRSYSVDPGLGGTGWAEWRGKKAPTRVGVIAANRRHEDELAARCEDIAYALSEEIKWGGGLYTQVHVILELPQHMTSLKGIAAQAGAVYKLAFLVGYLAKAVYPCTVHVVTPGEWKGQLPKDVVQRRITKHLGEETCRALNIRTHAWDAVGIGLWTSGWRIHGGE